MKQVLAIAALALVLSACGFRPLYGPSQSGGSVAADVTSIAVAEQRTRVGQLVRNEVLSAGKPEVSRFRLELKVSEAHPFVSRLPGERVDRLRAQVMATYVLRDLNAKVITQGSTRAAVAYDVVREPVADAQAKATAIQRAAIEVGQDIKLRLAAALSQ
jgi:LPS-assembly lipoprotein